jgi:hypothetical protein
MAALARPVPETGAAAPGRWLVSRAWDLAMFGAPAAAAFLLLAWGWWDGILDQALPPWAWVVTVLGVDVAHVWSTAYRVYLDPEERRRRPGLYGGIPLAAYVGGVLLYSASPSLFWRVLAYLAVLHFVRQQYGWVALYRRRLGVASVLDRWLDDAAVYAATLYPLLHWHANLPREFAWLIDGDFLPGLPAWVATVAWPAHLAITAAYALRQLQLAATGRPVSAGKNLVIATTWATWYVGIVAFDSDYAFTVTNVLVHGVPYLGLIWVHGRRRYAESGASRSAVASLFTRGWWPVFVATAIAAAWMEEWGWDRLVWHERGALFPGLDVFPSGSALALVVPLLALPQATHYLLDAWIWRVKGNPGLAERLGL